MTKRTASSPSVMLAEAGEAPEVVARQLACNRPLMARIARGFARSRPRFVVTSARGSSQNAAVYAKYLIETRLGLPVVSSSPSVGTLYRAAMDLSDAIFLCISQSGASFDLIENAHWARSRGARVISLLNTPDSPLGDASDVVVPLGAGRESSVAATKSHIASLSATLQLVAHLGDDAELRGVLDRLPDQLARARELDWSCAAPALTVSQGLYVVARGLGESAAREAALKLKEACRLHAEALGAAELMHGPISLVRAGFPILFFSQSDATGHTSDELVARLRESGASVFAAGLSTGASGVANGPFDLPVVPGVHATAAPLTLTQTCYGLVELVARRRALDPDRPLHLSKVTRTR